MTAFIGRREFITLLDGAATAWPLVAQAQQTAMPVVGFMIGRSPEDSAHLVAAFYQGLSEAGFVEGQNVAIEFRWARGQYGRLPGLAAVLVVRRVTVLIGLGGDASAVAAKQASFKPLYLRLRELILGSAKIAVDETVAPVLDPGRGRTKKRVLLGDRPRRSALGRDRSACRRLHLCAGPRCGPRAEAA